MQDLSLHILDIAQNAIRAGGDRIVIEIAEDEEHDKLTISIEDNGKGMNAEMVEKAIDPFFTTKDGRKFGLGLSLLAQAAQQAEGEFRIDSKQGAGTKIVAVFKLSHPDTKPMGDIVETMKTLIASNPERQFVFDYKKGDESHHFDSFE